MIKHTMLDIETLGTKPGSIVLSIGAVVFDLSGRTYDKFYVNIDRNASAAYGLTFDPDTAKWWREQPQVTQDALLVNPQQFQAALTAFREWFYKQDAPTIWCQGANFDAPLLEAAYRAAKQTAPWKFWNVRDTRTAYDLFDFDTRDVVRTRMHHNALDDAFHQVRLVATALRRGRSPEGSGLPTWGNHSQVVSGEPTDMGVFE